MKVSIITVNYNQYQVTQELIESLYLQDHKNLEIIVVDNGSMVDNTPYLRYQFPRIKVIRSEQNLGFAGGNNLGIAAATGKYLFFVNNDTEIPRKTIADLVSVLKENPTYGAVSPQVVYHQHPETTQYVGYTELSRWSARNHAIGHMQKLTVTDQVVKTAYTHGAAMMVKREVIENIGPMPELYFLYYEELDWGYKMKQAGYQNLVSHRSVVYHKESISTGKNSPLKMYFQTRNRILFVRRNYGRSKWLFFLFFSLFSFPKKTLQLVIKRDWSLLKAFTSGVCWNLINSKTSSSLGFGYDKLKGG